MLVRSDRRPVVGREPGNREVFSGSQFSSAQDCHNNLFNKIVNYFLASVPAIIKKA